MHAEFPIGIVEGFYGTPWSFEERMSMIDFLSAHRFNTYIYAPKDDLYHRSKWRAKYPSTLARRIALLAKKCQKKNILFVFTVSPGLSITYSSASEKNLLLKKLDFALDLGCNWIGVMLDDIKTSLVRDSDRRAFGSLAAAHCYLLNSIKDKLGKSTRLTFCPTYYANEYLGKNVSDNEYLTIVGSELEKEIDVMWTGRSVVSTRITKGDVLAFSRVIRREPFLWDNYPVNDYYRDANRKMLRLNLGPFKGRSCRAIKLLSGYVSNPMNQAEASKVPLLTLADMIQQGRTYSPQKSFERALCTLYSKDRAFEEIKLLIRASKANPLDVREAEDFQKIVSRIIASNPHGNKRRSALRLFEKKLHSYIKASSSLKAKVENTKILEELQPLLRKLSKLERLGVYCVDYAELSNQRKRKKGRLQDVEKKMHLAARAVRADRTQVLGEIRFAHGGSDMGLPEISRDSPLVQLYEYFSEPGA